MYFDEHVPSNPQSPPFFDNVVSEAFWSIGSHSLGSPRRHFSPSGPTYSSELTFSDSESSDPGPSIFDDEPVESEHHTPHTPMHGIIKSPPQDAAILSSSHTVSAAPARSVVTPCQWIDHGKPCNVLIDWKDVGVHLKGSHGIRNGSQEQITCRWEGCSRCMQHRALARHVAERHLGLSRTATKHSRGKEP